MKPNHTTVAVLMGFLVFLLLGTGLITDREPINYSPPNAEYDPLQNINTSPAEVFSGISSVAVLLYSFAGLTVIAIIIVLVMILEESRKMIV